MDAAPMFIVGAIWVIGIIIAVAWVILPFTIISHMNEIEKLLKAQGTVQTMMAQEMKIQTELMSAPKGSAVIAPTGELVG